MSLWKDEIPTEISASLFNKNYKETNLNHHMFSSTSKTTSSSTTTTNTKSVKNKTKDNLFSQKIHLSNGINLFEDNEINETEQIIHKQLSESSYDFLEFVTEKPNKLSDQNLFNNESDEDDEPIFVPKVEKKIENNEALDYKKLYEEERKMRLALEKEVEKLRKQLSKFNHQLKEDDKLKVEEDVLLQDKILTPDERLNLQLNRLKKSAVGTKKKSKTGDPVVNNPVKDAVKDTEVRKMQSRDVASEQPEVKKESSHHQNLFTDSDSENETIGITLNKQQEEKQPKANLWGSSDEEGYEKEPNIGFNLEDPTKQSLEREKIEKQKARQRQLNQRNRRGGGTTTKRRLGANSHKPQQQNESPKEIDQQVGTKDQNQTIPRTAGSNWSDDEDDSDESEEQSHEANPQNTFSDSPKPPSTESSIEQIVLVWCRGKDLVKMIYTLHEVPRMSISTIAQLNDLNSHTFCSYQPQDVRKIYLKIARIFHPDKQRGSQDENLLNAKIFAALTDAYNHYKAINGL